MMLYGLACCRFKREQCAHVDTITHITLLLYCRICAVPFVHRLLASLAFLGNISGGEVTQTQPSHIQFPYQIHARI